MQPLVACYLEHFPAEGLQLDGSRYSLKIAISKSNRFMSIPQEHQMSVHILLAVAPYFALLTIG